MKMITWIKELFGIYDTPKTKTTNTAPKSASKPATSKATKPAAKPKAKPTKSKTSGSKSK